MPDFSLSAAGGQQQFLQLLLTQLQHQDPLEPMEQTDFLAQLAQFSSLEGIQQLNTRFDDLLALQELTEGANLLGRTVTYLDPSTGQEASGIVSAAHVDGDRIVLSVGNQRLTLDQLHSLVQT